MQFVFLSPCIMIRLQKLDKFLSVYIWQYLNLTYTLQFEMQK